MSFRFVDGCVHLYGKALTGGLLARLRKEKPSITTHFERVHREQFLDAVQVMWPGAHIITDEEKAERAQFAKELLELTAANAWVYSQAQRRRARS